MAKLEPGVIYEDEDGHTRPCGTGGLVCSECGAEIRTEGIDDLYHQYEIMNYCYSCGKKFDKINVGSKKWNI